MLYNFFVDFVYVRESMFQVNRPALKAAFKNTIPVLTGYLVLGFGFGVLLVSQGFEFWLAPIMSISMYAGAMQYLAVDLLSYHVDLINVAIATLVVNARHLFYGISLIDKYKDAGWRKVLLAFGLTDETYSLIASETKTANRDYYLYVTLLDHLYWITGSTLGALAGTVLPFDSTGIDFALTALFVTIFTEQWLTNTQRKMGALGIVVSLVCLFIFGAQQFLIPTLLVITLILSWVYRKAGDKL